MKKTKLLKKRLNTSVILIAIVFASIFMSFAVDFTNDNSESEEVSEEIEVEPLEEPITEPTTSATGEADWWDEDFFYRRKIQINNVGTDDFVDSPFGYIVFNYSEIVALGHMNASLKDVRIVENGVLRDYFIKKDYPANGNVTIWFKMNSTAGQMDEDVYLYYGNDTVEQDPTHLMANSPVGISWWDNEEGSGDIAIDRADHNDGTHGNQSGIHTDPQYVDASTYGMKGDYALDYGSTTNNAYVQMPNDDRFNLQRFTISCWIYSTDYDQRGFLFEKGPVNTQYSLFFHNSNDGTVYFRTYGLSDRDLDVDRVSILGIEDGKTYHIAASYDGTTKKIWVNGEVRAQEGSTGTINTGAQGQIIGAYGAVTPGGYWYGGVMDDTRVYDYALDDTEMDMLVANNYTLQGIINAETEQGAEVAVTIKDVDGRVVPNALVGLFNITSGDLLFNATTNTEGIATFTDIPYDYYHQTVNYTMENGTGIQVYNSTVDGGTIRFAGLFESIELHVNLYSRDIEVDDWDMAPMNCGYINFSLTKDGAIIETLQLNSSGKATFRYPNNPIYWSYVYFNNSDYYDKQILLNTTNFSPETTFATFNVNETNILPSGPEYRTYIQNVYVEGSGFASPGQFTILEAKIDMTNMLNNLSLLDVWYLDSTDTPNRIIDSQGYLSEIEDSLWLNISDDYEYDAHALRVDVRGENHTQNCDGIINVTLTYANKLYIKTNFTQMEIRIVDEATGAPVPGVFINITQNITYDPVVNLTTRSDTDGYAYGINNPTFKFWHWRDAAYNISLSFFGDYKYFNINYTNPGQWNATHVKIYNYTLQQSSSIIFELEITLGEYFTNFSYEEGDASVIWGENMNYLVTFNYTTDGGNNWILLTNPDYVTCTVKNWQGEVVMINTTTQGQASANYTFTLNSSLFSAGSTSENYVIIITGGKQGYSDPSPVYIGTTVNAIPTNISLHNYTDTSQSLNELTTYYGELANVTVKYVNDNNQDVLTPESITYDSSDIGTGSLNPHPTDAGFYYFTLNTSEYENTGTKRIDVIASRENHTTFTFEVIVNIDIRLTQLNGSDGVTYISKQIKVWVAYNFTFNYSDYTNPLSPVSVTDLDEQSFLWQRLDSTGAPIIGESGTGNLNTTLDDLYVLDLDTENMEVGKYFIYIKFSKLNYDDKEVIINLEIEKRDIGSTAGITVDGTSDISADKIIVTVVQGKSTIDMTFTLTDTLSELPLTGVTVSLTIGGNVYTFTEGAGGVYTLSFPTADIDAFFTSQTLTGTLTLSLDNYNDISIDTTFIIAMVESPIPGIPMFYFLMIVGAIIAVVGSLTISSAIRNAKIPTFIKKTDKVKSAIKSRKDISESDLYPTKNQMILKKFGDSWEKLELDLEDILGIKITKAKKMPDMKEITDMKEDPGGAIE